MDQRLILVYILIPMVSLGVIASTVINNQGSPIEYRVQNVELVDIASTGEMTHFSFNTTAEIWNQRYQNVRISHARSCEPQTGAISNIEGFRMVDQPICSSLLPQTSTSLEAGLNQFDDTIVIEFPGDLDQLPAGIYNFIVYPATQELNGRIEYQVLSDGSIDISKKVPSGWGEMKPLQTPFIWYIPAYFTFIILIFKQIQVFYKDRYESTMEIIEN